MNDKVTESSKTPLLRSMLHSELQLPPLESKYFVQVGFMLLDAVSGADCTLVMVRVSHG